MDTDCNARATRFSRSLAERHGINVDIRTAKFDDGTEGYSVTLTDPQPGHYSGQIATFYNDDRYGPRWIGKCGIRIPGHKLPGYVTFAVANPNLHPSNINATILEK
jgi:hypothetical protein